MSALDPLHSSGPIDIFLRVPIGTTATASCPASAGALITFAFSLAFNVFSLWLMRRHYFLISRNVTTVEELVAEDWAHALDHTGKSPGPKPRQRCYDLGSAANWSQVFGEAPWPDPVGRSADGPHRISWTQWILRALPVPAYSAQDRSFLEAKDLLDYIHVKRTYGTIEQNGQNHLATLPDLRLVGMWFPTASSGNSTDEDV